MSTSSKIFYPGEIVQFKEGEHCSVNELAWRKFVVLYCSDMQSNLYSIALDEYVQLNNVKGEYLCRSR